LFWEKFGSGGEVWEEKFGRRSLGEVWEEKFGSGGEVWEKFGRKFLA